MTDWASLSPHHQDAEGLGCGRKLRRTRLGLKKAEASRGPGEHAPGEGEGNQT